jgi:hypothetical protein
MQTATLFATKNGVAYLHKDLWDLLDTMGPDGSTYAAKGDMIVFEGHSPSEAASWIFRIASQAKTEILTIFLRDDPDRASMILLARLMETLEGYLGGTEGSLFSYWLEGSPNAKMLKIPDHQKHVSKLDAAMHQKKAAYLTLFALMDAPPDRVVSENMAI